MMTIRKIKQMCIELDMSNIEVGDSSIGTHIDGKFFQFRDLHDVELFYSNISLKELLKIYAQYNGLEDYRIENPKDYRESYNLDLLTIIDFL